MIETATQKYTPQVLNVLVWPDEGLKEKCVDVTNFDTELEHFAFDLLATMASRGGVGLAAPQVGRLLNMFVIQFEEGKPIIFINPKITVIGKQLYEWEEGCLSIPGYFEKRKRPENIAVTFNDVTGKEHSVHFGKLYAFAIQHEYDHLQGNCFIDKLSWWKKEKIKKKIRKSLPEFIQRAEEFKLNLLSKNTEL